MKKSTRNRLIKIRDSLKVLSRDYDYEHLLEIARAALKKPSDIDAVIYQADREWFKNQGVLILKDYESPRSVFTGYGHYVCD